MCKVGIQTSFTLPLALAAHTWILMLLFSLNCIHPYSKHTVSLSPDPWRRVQVGHILSSRVINVHRMQPTNKTNESTSKSAAPTLCVPGRAAPPILAVPRSVGLPLQGVAGAGFQCAESRTKTCLTYVALCITLGNESSNIREKFPELQKGWKRQVFFLSFMYSQSFPLSKKTVSVSQHLEKVEASQCGADVSQRCLKYCCEPAKGLEVTEIYWGIYSRAWAERDIPRKQIDLFIVRPAR